MNNGNGWCLQFVEAQQQTMDYVPKHVHGLQTNNLMNTVLRADPAHNPIYTRTPNHSHPYTLIHTTDTDVPHTHPHPLGQGLTYLNMACTSSNAR